MARGGSRLCGKKAGGWELFGAGGGAVKTTMLVMIAKKIFLMIAIVVCVIFIGGSIINNSDALFKGDILSSTSKTSSPQKKYKQELVKIRSLLKKRNIHPEIRTLMQKKELLLIDYLNKLQRASEKEREQILHLLGYEQFTDNITYAKQMVALSNVVDSLEKLTVNSSKKVKQFQLQNPSLRELQTLDVLLRSAQEKAIQWKTAYQNGEPLKKIDSLIDAWRSSAQKDIRMMQKAFMKMDTNSNSEYLQILKALETIIFKLPKRPASPELTTDSKKPSPRPKRSLKIGICVMRWTVDAPEISTDLLRDQLENVKTYYKNVSYNKEKLEITGYGGNRIWEGPVPENEDTETQAAIQTCDQDFDFRNIDALIIYPSLIADTAGISGSGGPRTVITDEGEFTIGIARIGGIYSFAWALVAHELGHALYNFPHARALECSATAFSNSGCFLLVLGGSPFDLMGSTNREGAFSAWLRWITDRDWLRQEEITADGVYQLGVLETAATVPQLLRVKFEENPLCIEYRKPLARDAESGLRTPVSTVIPEDGCLLISICSKFEIDKSEEIFSLIDTTPASSLEDDFGDACLQRSENFSNADLGIELSFTPRDSSSINVNINLDETKMAP